MVVEQMTQLSKSCEKEFELVGDATRICISTSEWSGESPVCQSNPGNELILVMN